MGRGALRSRTPPQHGNGEWTRPAPLDTSYIFPSMAKPVLFAIDDDPEVLRAIERDLRREYGEHYRVMRANSGPSALDALASSSRSARRRSRSSWSTSACRR